MRVLALTAAQRLPDLSTFYAALGERVSLDVRRLEKPEQRDLRRALRGLDFSSYERVLLDIPFKNIYRQGRYLRQIAGLLIYEEDACQNYLPSSRWQGAFSRLYRQLPQARVLVTGANLAARLQSEGFDVRFLAKGYDQRVLRQQCLERDIELGFVGRTASADYVGRKQLLDQLSACEPLQVLRADPGEAYCRLLNRIRYFISADVGLGEYMAKNFEAMACGCVLLAWYQGDEEAAIGLEDGRHLLLYRDLAELRSQLAALRADPARAQRIADAGRAFVEANLSYTHLANRMAECLFEPRSPSMPLSGWPAFWQRLRFF
jgi:hypothetical protein